MKYLEKLNYRENRSPPGTEQGGRHCKWAFRNCGDQNVLKLDCGNGCLTDSKESSRTTTMGEFHDI
jgi:hypothetical protein